MYPQEMALIDETFATLARAVADPTNLPQDFPGSAHLDALIRVLERWPPGAVYPCMSSSLLERAQADSLFVQYSIYRVF